MYYMVYVHIWKHKRFFMKDNPTSKRPSLAVVLND